MAARGSGVLMENMFYSTAGTTSRGIPRSREAGMPSTRSELRRTSRSSEPRSLEAAFKTTRRTKEKQGGLKRKRPSKEVDDGEVTSPESDEEDGEGRDDEKTPGFRSKFRDPSQKAAATRGRGGVKMVVSIR